MGSQGSKTPVSTHRLSLKQHCISAVVANQSPWLCLDVQTCWFRLRGHQQTTSIPLQLLLRDASGVWNWLSSVSLASLLLLWAMLAAKRKILLMTRYVSCLLPSIWSCLYNCFSGRKGSCLVLSTGWQWLQPYCKQLEHFVCKVFG